MLGAASKGGSFSRRPGLPPEALVDSEMLERSFAELDAWDEWLENVDAFHPQFMRFPPFVVVSYAWGAREHPDADPGVDPRVGEFNIFLRQPRGFHAKWRIFGAVCSLLRPCNRAPRLSGARCSTLMHC